ncbi:hypothetical protein SUGI_0627680 [Cryptomeria japonica]|nr:hypothetical protein SUGI_0627680 [Cryptomeria japonica]
MTEERPLNTIELPQLRLTHNTSTRSPTMDHGLAHSTLMTHNHPSMDHSRTEEDLLYSPQRSLSEAPSATSIGVPRAPHYN